MPRNILQISLSLSGETLELELTDGRTFTLRQGAAEEILINMLRKRQATTDTTIPRYVPADCIPDPRKFTSRGREILPELSLEDLGI